MRKVFPLRTKTEKLRDFSFTETRYPVIVAMIPKFKNADPNHKHRQTQNAFSVFIATQKDFFVSSLAQVATSANKTRDTAGRKTKKIT